MDIRVTSAYTQNILSPARQSTPHKREDFGGKTGDTISLSSFAKEYQLAKNAAAAVPDIREDLVASLGQMIESGTYNISPARVAAKIFGE